AREIARQQAADVGGDIEAGLDQQADVGRSQGPMPPRQGDGRVNGLVTLEIEAEGSIEIARQRNTAEGPAQRDRPPNAEGEPEEPPRKDVPKRLVRAGCTVMAASAGVVGLPVDGRPALATQERQPQ